MLCWLILLFCLCAYWMNCMKIEQKAKDGKRGKNHWLWHFHSVWLNPSFRLEIPRALIVQWTRTWKLTRVVLVFTGCFCTLFSLPCLHFPLSFRSVHLIEFHPINSNNFLVPFEASVILTGTFPKHFLCGESVCVCVCVSSEYQCTPYTIPPK